jgi:hypothetical protein
MCYWNAPHQVRTIDDGIWNNYVDFLFITPRLHVRGIRLYRVRTYVSMFCTCSPFTKVCEFEIDSQGEDPKQTSPNRSKL